MHGSLLRKPVDEEEKERLEVVCMKYEGVQARYMTGEATVRCGNQTSRIGRVTIIVDRTRSEIAKRVGIDVNGKFALKVR